MVREMVGIDRTVDHESDKGTVRHLQECRVKGVEAEPLDDQCSTGKVDHYKQHGLEDELARRLQVGGSSIRDIRLKINNTSTGYQAQGPR
jgi:hypothetical protein